MSTLGGVRDVGSTSSWKSGISEPDGGAEGPMWVDGVVRGKEQEGSRAYWVKLSQPKQGRCGLCEGGEPGLRVAWLAPVRGVQT